MESKFVKSVTTFPKNFQTKELDISEFESKDMGIVNSLTIGDIVIENTEIRGISNIPEDDSAINKEWYDDFTPNYKYKNPARAATVSNIVLLGVFSIDGVSVQPGERVLVKQQLNSAENGVYIVSIGAWSRSDDCKENDSSSIYILVLEGNSNGKTTWFTIGTTFGNPLLFYNFLKGPGNAEGNDGEVQLSYKNGLVEYLTTNSKLKYINNDLYVDDTLTLTGDTILLEDSLFKNSEDTVTVGYGEILLQVNTFRVGGDITNVNIPTNSLDFLNSVTVNGDLEVAFVIPFTYGEMNTWTFTSDTINADLFTTDYMGGFSFVSDEETPVSIFLDKAKTITFRLVGSTGTTVFSGDCFVPSGNVYSSNNSLVEEKFSISNKFYTENDKIVNKNGKLIFTGAPGPYLNPYPEKQWPNTYIQSTLNVPRIKNLKKITAVTAPNPYIYPPEDPVPTYLASPMSYIDSKNHKNYVKVTSKVPMILSDIKSGTVIDNITLVLGDRILLKEQANSSENGIYIVGNVGPPTRSGDAALNSLATGSIIISNEGSLKNVITYSSTVPIDDTIYYKLSNVVTAHEQAPEWRPIVWSNTAHRGISFSNYGFALPTTAVTDDGIFWSTYNFFGDIVHDCVWMENTNLFIAAAPYWYAPGSIPNALYKSYDGINWTTIVGGNTVERGQCKKLAYSKDRNELCAIIVDEGIPTPRYSHSSVTQDLSTWIAGPLLEPAAEYSTFNARTLTWNVGHYCLLGQINDTGPLYSYIQQDYQMGQPWHIYQIYSVPNYAYYRITVKPIVGILDGNPYFYGFIYPPGVSPPFICVGDYSGNWETYFPDYPQSSYFDPKDLCYFSPIYTSSKICYGTSYGFTFSNYIDVNWTTEIRAPSINEITWVPQLNALIGSVGGYPKNNQFIFTTPSIKYLFGIPRPPGGEYFQGYFGSPVKYYSQSIDVAENIPLFSIYYKKDRGVRGSNVFFRNDKLYTNAEHINTGVFDIGNMTLFLQNLYPIADIYIDLLFDSIPLNIYTYKNKVYSNRGKFIIKDYIGNFTGTDDGIHWSSVAATSDVETFSSPWYGVSPIESSTNLTFLEVFRSDGNFSIEHTGKIMTTTDLINFTEVFSPPLPTIGFKRSALAWSPSLEKHFYVINGYTDIYNPDGNCDGIFCLANSDLSEWSTVSYINVQPGLWCAGTWSPQLGQFCILADIGSTGHFAPFYKSALSYDGINWIVYDIDWPIGASPVSYPFTDGYGTTLSCCVWSGDLGIFMATRMFAHGSMISSNGIDWSTVSVIGDSTESLNRVKWVPELSIFIGPAYFGNELSFGSFYDRSLLMYSYDGLYWTYVLNSPPYSEKTDVNWSVEYNCLYACASDSKIYEQPGTKLISIGNPLSTVSLKGSSVSLIKNENFSGGIFYPTLTTSGPLTKKTFFYTNEYPLTTIYFMVEYTGTGVDINIEELPRLPVDLTSIVEKASNNGTAVVNVTLSLTQPQAIISITGTSGFSIVSGSFSYQ